MNYVKGLVICGLLVTLLVYVTGCSSPPADPSGYTVSGSEITFWAMTNAPSDLHYIWMNEKAAEFEALTGVKVTFEEIGWGEAWQKITNAVYKGEGAHVFQLGSTWNSFFAANGGLLRLDIDQFGGSDRFVEQTLESCIYEGNYYGIPWFAETRVLFYNKDMFSAAGVEPPQTWPELLTVGQKITDRFGKGTAISIAGYNAWDLIHNWAVLLWSNGGEILSYDNTTADFNTSAGLEAVDYWVGLVSSGLASEACLAYNQPQADADFTNGKVAMCFMAPWNVSYLDDHGYGLNYGVIEVPAGSSGRAFFVGGSNLAIRSNASAVEIEAAKQWIQFLLEKSRMVEYTRDLSHMLPVTLEAYNDTYFLEDKWIVFRNALSNATPYPVLPDWGQIEGEIQKALMNVLKAYENGSYNQTTSEAYLNEAATAVNNILQ